MSVAFANATDASASMYACLLGQSRAERKHGCSKLTLQDPVDTLTSCQRLSNRVHIVLFTPQSMSLSLAY